MEIILFIVLIIIGIVVWQVEGDKIRSWIKKSDGSSPVFRGSLPTIYTIQASDAPQHTGRLQEILQNLKSKNRIDGFTTLGIEDDLSSLTENMEEEDFILIVLTRGMESQREQINDPLKAFKMANPGAGIAEIIVDNVPYENIFYTLPESLRPIRDQEDMEVAWSGIEQSLKNMFPAPPETPDPPVLPDVNLPGWLQGVLEWPWESPGRWHGALFLGLPALVVITIALYLIIPTEFEREPLSMLLFSFLAGGVHGVAGAISRMRKAPLFFAVALAVGVMVLFVLFWGIDDVDDYLPVALVFIGPVAAVVGAWAGRSDDPVRLTGMILLGFWPWLFAESEPYDSAFLFNSVIIAVVLCIIAWLKPVEPKRAVKIGSLPFALNLAGGYLIYMMAAERGLEGSAFGLTFVTVIAAASLGLVYWLNKKKYLEDA